MTRMIGNERGIALPLAVLALAILGALATAYLSLGLLEPRISRNHADATRARYVADAGLEWGYSSLVSNNNWNSVLAGGSPAGTMASGMALPGLATTAGTFTLTVRNDNQAGDNQITGVALDTGNNATDTNGIVILTATGTFNGATRKVRAVLQRTSPPPLPGALNMPGVQTDVIAEGDLDIDGRDYNRDGTLGSGPMRYGVQVQPGQQQNVAPLTYEQRVETALAAYNADVQGQNQSGGGLTQGAPTIAPDASLNPTNMGTFLSQVASNPRTNILQSTMSCPIVLTPTATTNQTTLTNGCGMNQTLDLGTTTNPKLIYVRGDLDPSSLFTGLHVESGGPVTGAGILIVEDGDLRINDNANFRWDGIVMVVGRYVGAGFRENSTTTIYGALVSMETIWNEVAGFNEFRPRNGSTVQIRTSQQNINLVMNLPGLHKLYSYLELDAAS
jgi:Tfp pilus assembly protein PilX